MSQNYWENNKKDDYWNKKTAAATGIEQEAGGLQQFMIQTFTWMTLGLALTGVVAALTISNEALVQFIFGNTIVFIGLIIAEFAMVIGFGVMLRKGANASTLLMMFLAYAALNGLTLSVILLLYTAQSIASTFFVTAGMFGGMSLYGYVTKKDLTGVGQFMIMGLWGIIIAMIVNFFLKSSILGFAISLIGVAVFLGLTAYDTQKLKAYYQAMSHDENALKRMALGGALMLYLDFINLFLFLLRLMGNRR